MIKVENVSKSYGKNPGVLDLSLEVKKNEIVGLIGRNGAGKSTALNIISGYISSDYGNVEIKGYNILENSKKAKACLGYLPEKPPLYMDMTVIEYLYFCADLKGVDVELKNKHIDEICMLTAINDVRDRLCRNLSKGYKQRVGLAQALVGNPEILILDEPAIGLDPNQIIQIRELIKKLSNKHTIIISSHILGEIAKVCDRVIILDKGRIAASDTVENLGASFGNTRMLEVQVLGADDEFADALRKINGVLDVKLIGEKKESCEYSIAYSSKKDISECVFDCAVKNKKKILMMKSNKPTLEDIFINITQVKGDE